MFSFFKKKKQPLTPKDPTDFTLTDNSTEWDTDYFCPHCKNTVSLREEMAKVCNSCGGFVNWMSDYKLRSFRQIWNGSKWVWQYKYGNERDQIILSDNPIHRFKFWQWKKY